MAHTNHPLTIRRAGAADLGSLALLAALDDARAPSGRMLVAEQEGRMLAAVPFDPHGPGRAIADPFEPTAEIVALLEWRARQIADADSHRRKPMGLLRRLRARAA